MNPSEIDRAILGLAARSNSVVHARDLRAAGVTRGAVATRVRRGLMAPILGRTYGVGPDCTTPTVAMRCMAGLLVGGRGSALDHETAATLLDVWERGSSDVHVCVRDRSVESRPGFLFHQAALGWRADPRLVLGTMHCVAFVDMCRRLACDLTPWQLASVIDRGRHRGLVRVEDLVLAVERYSGHRGNATLRRAVELVLLGSVGTRSPSEDGLLADVLGAGIEEPLVNVRGCMGMSRDEPDFVWRGRMRNVEMDGRHHDREPQRSDDAARDRELAQRWWGVLRVPAWMYRRYRKVTVRRVLHFLDGGDVELAPGTRQLRL